jgi:hypothetical protein
VAVFFCATLVLYFFVWLTKWRSHSMIGKHGSIFGIGQHGGILPPLRVKSLHNKHLYHIDSPWHDGCYLNWRVPLTKFMKTISIPPPAPICTSAFRSDTIPPCGTAPSVILDEGYRLSRSAPSFFRAVRVFLFGLIDSSAFHNDSLGREVSIIFTSSGPLIYRWEPK